MSDYLTGLTDASYLANTQSEITTKLKSSLSSTDFTTATDEELMDACKTFEAYFIEQAFKGMEKMLPEHDKDSGSTSYVDMFKDKLYQEYAESATGRGDGIGIAKMLFEQMKRNYSVASVYEMETDSAEAVSETAEASMTE